VCAGSVPHAKVNVPEEPFSGVTVSLYCVICPLATEKLSGVSVLSAKSKPMPVSVDCTLAGRLLLDTLNVPVCAPAATGANTTLTVQFAPADSDVPQVVPVISNPAAALSARLLNVTAPVLVTVTVCAALACPAPVVANVSNVGSRLAEPAWPPSPVNATTAGAYVEEPMVNASLNEPFAAGVNATPAVQLAPAARLVPQVFSVRLKGEAVVSVSPAAASVPEFVTVTVCATLLCPTVATTKFS